MRSTLVLLLVAALPLRGAAEQTRPLNVLFILSDDMRPDLGCYGHPMVKSPNLDALARSGVRFDRAYCQYPLCNPSRTSMLTGRHPTTTGVLNNQDYFRTAHPDWVTLPEHFKRNGYATLRTGKIFHGGIDDRQSWTEGADPQVQGSRPRPDATERRRASDRIVTLEGDGEMHADFRTAEKAMDYLREHKDQPFFLACGFVKPHSPPTAPARYFDLYDLSQVPLPVNFAATLAVPAGFPKPCLSPNGDLFIGREATEVEAREVIRAYWSSISWVDWNVGRVLAALDELGLRQSTVVVFWGDHGYHLGEMGKWAKHGSLFEVGTRVPLIVAAPGMKANGQSVALPVQSLDLFPTLCELCGLKPPAGLEGHSLKRLLDDPTAAWDHPAYTAAGNVANLGVAVRTARYRYAHWDGGRNGAMLFDQSADPHELRNLAGEPGLADVQKRLEGLARAYALAEADQP